jgi:hypothetical protein
MEQLSKEYKVNAELEPLITFSLKEKKTKQNDAQNQI